MKQNVDQPDKQSNRNTCIATVANNELLSNSKGVVTVAGFHNDHAQTDKYCLELQTTLKGEMRIAKNNSANKRMHSTKYPTIWLYYHLWVTKLYI